MFLVLILETSATTDYIFKTTFLKTDQIHIFIFMQAQFFAFEVTNLGIDRFGWFHMLMIWYEIISIW